MHSEKIYTQKISVFTNEIDDIEYALVACKTHFNADRKLTPIDKKIMRAITVIDDIRHRDWYNNLSGKEQNKYLRYLNS